MLKLSLSMDLPLFVCTVFITILAQKVFDDSIDWCWLKCGADHTMCQYQRGGRCETTLTDDDISVVVDTHNRLRSTVATANGTGQPGASNMRALSWDREAAEIAQRWASTCPTTHDKCRVLRNNGSLGQNQAFRTTSQVKARKTFITEMIDNWFGEIEDMDPSSVSAFKPSGAVSQYTQIVWADTYRVGCGIGIPTNGTTNEYYLVCNYYPAGNVENKPVYLEGNACSNCPQGTTCSSKWPGLCYTLDVAEGIPIEIDIPLECSSALFTKSSLIYVVHCVVLHTSCPNLLSGLDWFSHTK